MLKIIFNKTFIVQIILTIVFSMLATFLMHTVLTKNPHAIATVNMVALQDSFINETARASISKEEKQQRITLFSQSLMHAINQIAEEKKATILLSEAVIAGNQDYTEEVAHLIKQGMSA